MDHAHGQTASFLRPLRSNSRKKMSLDARDPEESKFCSVNKKHLLWQVNVIDRVSSLKIQMPSLKNIKLKSILNTRRKNHPICYS